MHRYVVVSIISLLLIPFATAGMQVETFEAGLFKTSSPTVDADERVIGGKEEIIATRQIPAELGVKFGLRFTLAGKNPAGSNQVTYFYLTPGVIEPNGVRRDKYQVTQSLSATAPYHLIAFEFTEAYEVVPGEWQLMVFEDDRLLLKESFAVGISEDKLSSPPAEKPKTLKSVIQAVE